MKKIIILALLCATPAAAEDHVCKAIGQLGETVMTVRQSGTPMSDLMGAMPQLDTQVRGLSELMVRMAYEEPLYSTDSNQRQAVVQFRDRIEVMCFNSELGS